MTQTESLYEDRDSQHHVEGGPQVQIKIRCSRLAPDLQCPANNKATKTRRKHAYMTIIIHYPLNEFISLFKNYTQDISHQSDKIGVINATQGDT
jgi:hypothetical protein